MVVACVCAAAVVSFAACGGPGGSDSEATLIDGGTARVGLTSPVSNFDPYSLDGFGVAKYAYDSLVNITIDGDIVSGLATEWDSTATSATFTLRPDVTCSDGSTLTATDVADAITYASDPANQLQAAQLLLPSVPFTVEGDDDTSTVEVVMSEPYSFSVRTVGLLPIVCPSGLADPESLTSTTHGTGPYELADYSSAGPYELTVRDGYAWGPDGASTDEPGVPAKVVISVVPSEATKANLLTAGDLEIAVVAGPDQARLDAAGLFSAPIPTVAGITYFNQAAGRPLADTALRTALIEALDRQALANVAVGGEGKPATALGPANAVCHADIVDANLPEGDALDTLAAAGWSQAGGRLEKDGDQLSIRVLTLSSDTQLMAVAELMGKMWADLGIDIEMLAQDATSFTSTLYETGNWDVLVGASSISLPTTLIPVLSGPPPPDGTNFSHIENDEYSSAVSEALTKEDTDSCPFWQQADAALLQAADILPIAESSTYYWGQNVRFALTATGANSPAVDPSSIRLSE